MASLSQQPAMQSRSSFGAPWVIFWTAFALRVACIVIGHTYRVRTDDGNFYFGFEAGRIARSIVEGHGYGNPFNGPSGPTAWLPPLYPLLMALAFKLFGVYARDAAFFLLVCNSVFSAAIVPAVYEIAARCFDAQGLARRLSRRVQPVAWWSAWTWAVYPAALQFAVHWIWEMSLSACLFTWALVIALRLRRIGEAETEPLSAQQNALLWAVLGVLWGLIALSNASLMLVFPASLVWVLWPTIRRAELRGRFMQTAAGAVGACIMFAVTLTPWVARNERAMHTFCLSRDNFGVELWQSTHFYYVAFPWGTAMPLWPQAPEFLHYVRVGEVKYAHEKQTEAVANLRAHPGLFLRNTAYRLDFFWSGVPHPTEPHPENEVIRTLNYAFVSVAGLMGLALAMCRRVPGIGLFAWVFALLPAAYYLVTVQARFRHPLEPLIAILAVYLFRSAEPRSGGA